MKINNMHLYCAKFLEKCMSYNKQDVKILQNIVEKRRTVKPHSYNGALIDDVIVQKILESANWAPNHGRTEPWRFRVYSGDGRNTLLELMKSIYTEITPPEKFNPAKIDKMEVNCRLSSHIIVIMMKRQEIERVPEIEEIEAVACAVQNLALTAAAYNVAGYWSSGSITYKEETRKAMGLSEKDLVLGFYYLGLTDEQWPAGKRCSSIDEKTEWIKE